MKSSMKNDWRGLFAPWILERGKLYFESGAVLSINKTEDGYKAVVEGSEDYNVSIDVDECGEFIDADCDYPYSEAGNYCKHEAAVLYAIENEFDDYEMSSGKESIEQPLESLDSVISSMSEEDLRAFVSEAATAWKPVRDYLYSLYSDALPEGYSDEIMAEARVCISEIKEGISNDEYYDDWNDYSGYDVVSSLRKLQSIADEKLLPLVSGKKLFRTSFSLALNILCQIPFAVLNDYGYGLEDLMDSYSHILAESYVFAADKDKNAMEAEALEIYRNKKLSSSFVSILRAFLIDIVKNMEVAEMELKAALERLVQDPESSENAEIAFSSMKVLGKSDDEIAAFYDKFQYSWAVVDKYADVLISEGKTEKAISVIQAYRNEYHEYEIRISEKLLGIYREQKAFNKLSDELVYRIFTVGHFTLEHIHELKNHASESEWHELYERIVESGYASTRLLFEEEDYNRLMAYCEKVERIERDYVVKLSEIYPDRVIAILDKNLSTDEKFMNSRNAYKSYAVSLKSVGKFNGGEELQQKHLQDVIRRFPNRPALKDELRKAGFCI